MAKDLTGESPQDWDRRGLPGWAYHSPKVFEMERERLFLRHWQIAGHVNEMPEPGDFVTLDLLGERALVIRGHDGELRAFHNICRHRGTRVVAGDAGRCNKAIICPFHGWAYNLDGTLRGIAERASFPPLKKEDWGLRPLELEVWQGLVFVKFMEFRRALGRRDDGALRGRGRGLPVWPMPCRNRQAIGTIRWTPTGRRCAISTMRATMSARRIRRCMTCMAMAIPTGCGRA